MRFQIAFLVLYALYVSSYGSLIPDQTAIGKKTDLFFEKIFFKTPCGLIRSLKSNQSSTLQLNELIDSFNF